MRIVEIRDLDGPNFFLDSPAIKIEIGDVAAEKSDRIMADLAMYIRELHLASGLPEPEIKEVPMEAPGHLVVAFAWDRREFACTLGCRAAQLAIGERSDRDQIVDELKSIRVRDPEDDDAPLLVRADERSMPVIAITGTNGKTTTSRLISFVLRHSGYKVGLTSSAGVYIDTQQVLEGDYSGPSGARRVLTEPDVDFAVLETARGGMLLRGCGFEDADVVVITNVAADHLGVNGIYTIDGLAAVKAILARNVRRDGFCVLNADDPYVRAMAHITPGIPVFFSRMPDSEPMRVHLANGGSGVQLDIRGNFVWHHHGDHIIITNVADIPMTFDGRATHQVENAVAAIAALIGVEIPFADIRSGLTAFRSSVDDNKGRLNVYDVNGATVIIDFAHNETGLIHLLKFARGFIKNDGKLRSVVGTAGDRDNEALHAIARRAVELSDSVVLKDSMHYLRGREPGEMLAEMQVGVASANRPEVEVSEAPDERAATMRMLDRIRPDDVLAVMCVEDYDYLLNEIGNRGTPKI